MDNKINLKQSKNVIIKQVNRMHPLDIANEIFNFNDEERNYLIKLLPLNIIDNIFIELEADDAIVFFNLLDDIRKNTLLNDLVAADLKPLFLEFEEEDKERFLALLDINKRNELIKLIRYDETKVGSEMRNDFIKINANITVAEAMKSIINNVKDDDFIDDIYIVDEENHFQGSVELKKVIVARKNELVSALVNEKAVFVNENDNLTFAIKKISDYDIDSLPVVNDSNELVGIITAEDVLEELALDYEASVDKFVAVGDFDEESSPLKRAIQRLPWLLVSIVLNLIITLFLSVFENTISIVAALVLFQPLILGMAGNIGTQAIAVTILKLHNDEEDLNSKRNAHIKKELLIGVINAFIIAIMGFILSWIFLSINSFDSDKNINVIFIALTIGLSLFMSMTLSAFFGVLIPIILTKLKIDPAAASGPVISTINDLVALVIYFGLATLIIIPMVM